MWDLVKGVRRAFKARRVNTDSTIFKLHYQMTFGILVVITIILASCQYVGNPIRCLHRMGEQPDEVLNTFCWIHSTYTVTSAFYKKVGVEVPFPGVDNTRGNQNEIKVYRFYQWVPLCLLFQAILFYAPRRLWKNWEGGKLHALVMNLDTGIMIEEELSQKKDLLVKYLCDYLNHHNWWAYRYYVCEFLALVNVIGQMFLMNLFFDGEFLMFGIDVLKFMESDQEDRVDPMIYIFPRMTKCTFYKYGVSGEVERHDAVCILPLNVVNEKIYIFIWFWFLILGILTLGCVLYRIFIIKYPWMLYCPCRVRFRHIDSEDIRTIQKYSKMGDWFLFYRLAENVDSMIFRDVMHELAERLKQERCQSGSHRKLVTAP